MRSYSPGGVLNALAATPRGSIPPTPSTHRLPLGLPGYLILFATLAFALQRQYQPRKPPSLPVFFQISTHFTATPGIPLSSTVLKTNSIECRLAVKLPVFTSDLKSAYAPFTPSKSEQRLHPPYYRGCWHGVSRCFLCGYRQAKGSYSLCVSSPLTGFYTPRCFITHAALLRQTCVHCAIFPTAASRRSLGRISVPVWPIALSGRLSIAALVSRYLTNKLMERGPIPKRQVAPPLTTGRCHLVVLSGIRPPFEGLSRIQG